MKKSKYKSVNYDYSSLYPTIHFEGLKREIEIERLRKERIKKLNKINENNI